MNTNQPNKPRRRTAGSIPPSDELFDLARRKVEEEKMFLDPCLTLDMLAKELDMPRNALSTAVNRHAGMIFPVWVANYRIAEVERLVRLPHNRNVSLNKLVLEAGFANRTSFYRVYRSIKSSPWLKPETTTKNHTS